jgi:CRP-like cAMP-binding protein
MPDPDLLSILKHTRIFADLDDQTLVYLAHVSHIRNVSKGQAIFYQGDPGDAAYIVVKGKVSILLSTTDGRELVINEMSAGDCFGELALLLDEPRSASAIAGDDTQLVWIPCDQFLAEVESQPKLMRQLLETVASRLRNSGERESALAFLHAPARLAHFLLLRSERSRVSKNLVTISQWELAQHIGVTRQTVAKILGTWRRDGWIITGRGRIMLVDRKALEQLAQEAQV